MNYIYNHDELYHYGVLGMKWGHRKALPQSSVYERYTSTKSAYKDAKKAYNKSFNKYHNKSHQVFSPIKSHREANDQRFSNALSDAHKLNKAESAYKSAKKERQTAINKTYEQLNKNTSFKDKMIYNDATRKKAAKYIVDNNIPASEAIKKAKTAAWIDTAVTFTVAAAGTVAYNKLINK